MTKITIAEVARKAISDYRINSGDKEALQGRIAKKLGDLLMKIMEKILL